MPKVRFWVDYRCTNPRCGLLWEVPGDCPSCGHTFLAPQPKDVRGDAARYRPRPRRPDQTFAERAGRKRRLRRYRWAYPQLRLPLDTGVSVEGPPGSGKSTLATLVAQDLGSQGVPVLYVAAEEGDGEALDQRIRRCCSELLGGVAPSPGVLVSDTRDAYELEDALSRFPRGLVVLDSATEMRLNPTYLADMRARGLGVLVIQHWTTDKQPRGGLGTNYAVDVCLKVEQEHITITKSRWGELGSWDLTDLPQGSPEASGGPRGGVPFPGQGRPGETP